MAKKPSNSHELSAGEKSEKAASLSAWTIPDSVKVNKSAILQVRIKPFITINEALLTVRSESADFQITPGTRKISNLATSDGDQDPKYSPPDPPALGMTYVRRFEIFSPKPGSYTLKIKLLFDEKVCEKEVTINVQE